MGEQATHAPQESKQAPESNYISTVPRVKFGMTGSILAGKDEEGHNHYVSVLNDEVMGPTQYIQLVDLLYHAEEGDTITIKIYSPGGYVETGMMLCQAIACTKAKVITVAMSLVASIAAVVWLSGHERKMMPGSTLMIHMPSSAAAGKTLDVEDEFRQVNEYFAALLAKLSRGLLTEDEIYNVVARREDSFFSADVINERLARLEGGNHEPDAD